jgi:hypothetical protein
MALDGSIFHANAYDVRKSLSLKSQAPVSEDVFRLHRFSTTYRWVLISMQCDNFRRFTLTKIVIFVEDD